MNFKLANITATFITSLTISTFNPAYFSYSIIIFIVFFFFDLLTTKAFVKFKTSLLEPRVCLGIIFFYFSLLLASIINQDIAGLKETFIFISWILPAILLLYISNKYNTFSGISIGILSGAFFLCIQSIPSIFTYSDFKTIRLYTKLLNFNQLAMFLELILPFLFYHILICKKHLCRVGYTLVLAIVLICLLLTQSRGALVATTISIICSCLLYIYLTPKAQFILRLKKYRKQFLALGGALIIIFSLVTIVSIYRYNPNDHNFGTERGLMWETSLEMWNDHKLSGIGVSHWEEMYYGPYRPTHLIEPNAQHFHPHNMFLNYLSTAGIIGLLGYIVYMIFLFTGMYHLVRLSHSPAFVFIALTPFIAYFLHGLLDDTLVHKSVARLFYMMMSIVFIYYNYQYSKNKM